MQDDCIPLQRELEVTRRLDFTKGTYVEVSEFLAISCMANRHDTEFASDCISHTCRKVYFAFVFGDRSILPNFL